MLQLPNFGYMTASTRYLRIYKGYSRRLGLAIFSDIRKTVTIFIKIIFNDSRKVKGIRSYVSKHNLYPYFLIQQNLLISSAKMLMSVELQGCVT